VPARSYLVTLVSAHYRALQRQHIHIIVECFASTIDLCPLQGTARKKRSHRNNLMVFLKDEIYNALPSSRVLQGIYWRCCRQNICSRSAWSLRARPWLLPTTRALQLHMHMLHVCITMRYLACAHHWALQGAGRLANLGHCNSSSWRIIASV
jgi:hypothetical protein